MTIHAEYPTPRKPVEIPPDLRDLLSKSDGAECTCNAWNSDECACLEADWRSKDEILVDWIWRHPECDVSALMDAYFRENAQRYGGRQ